MRFIQLGNGGGLNPVVTNSSFLVRVKEEEYLLFDCGFNIMQRLIEIQDNPSNDFHISMIKYVYVSHIHDDHVGNVETLMFWNYFKNNIIMDFYYINSSVSEYFKSKIFPKLYTGGKIEFNNIGSRLHQITIYDCKLPGTKIRLIPLYHTFHGDCDSNGLIIENTSTGSNIVISGDTKASSLLEKEIMDNIKDYKKSIIYHDYSNWDCPSKNVHACETDFRGEYSEEFRNKITKYHTGDDNFIKEWQKW